MAGATAAATAGEQRRRPRRVDGGGPRPATANRADNGPRAAHRVRRLSAVVSARGRQGGASFECAAGSVDVQPSRGRPRDQERPTRRCDEDHGVGTGSRLDEAGDLHERGSRVLALLADSQHLDHIVDHGRPRTDTGLGWGTRLHERHQAACVAAGTGHLHLGGPGACSQGEPRTRSEQFRQAAGQRTFERASIGGSLLSRSGACVGLTADDPEA